MFRTIHVYTALCAPETDFVHVQMLRSLWLRQDLTKLVLELTEQS